MNDSQVVSDAQLIEEGLSEETFQRTRSFVRKYTNLLTKTNAAELGYLIDSKYYGIPEYKAYIQTSLAKLTREDVNRAIRKHLQIRNLHLIVVSDGAEDLKRKLASGEPSPMKYNSPKPEAMMTAARSAPVRNTWSTSSIERRVRSTSK